MPYHILESTSTGKLDFIKKSLALGPKKNNKVQEHNFNKTDQLSKILCS